uniref:Uncharacterized protein n=1 Tax=Neolamprologus brichardi TaxID=32507 RepID=A0A3Q4HXM8_NEOBR
MEFSATVILAGLILALLWLFSVKRRKYRLPPGPAPLPLLGNLPQIDKNVPFKSILKFSETYGPVMTLYMGWQRTVVLVGYDAVKEALVDQADDFTGRMPVPFLFKATKGYGLGISNGERWHQLRCFTLTTLRDFGMGRKGMEEWIQEVRLLHNISSFFFSLNHCSSLSLFFEYSSSNMTKKCSIQYLPEKLLSATLQHSNRVFFFSLSSQLYNICPRLMEWLPGSHHNVFAKLEEMRAFIMNKIQEHQDTLDASSPRDYIDCFLLRLNKVSTIRYASKVLIKYPKYKQEIDTVVGQRCPCMGDKRSLPYTDAVLHEIQHFLDIIPLSIPHYALHDISFRGYTIPKDTLIIPLLHSVLKDEKRWATPRSFNPQHFLDNNGNFKKNPAFLPFSAEILRWRVSRSHGDFLFLVSLLQHFTFSCLGRPYSIDLSLEYSGFANVPCRYTIIATPR